MTIIAAIFSLLNTDVSMALAIFTASLVLARLSVMLIDKYGSRPAKASGTTLGDDIMSSMKTPVFLAILVIGLQSALARSGLFANGVLANRIFYSLWITLGALVFIRLGSAFLKWLDEEAPARQKLMFREILPIIRQTWRLTIVAIAALMILDGFDVSITPLLASLGIAGLAVALAFQDTLANFFAGVYIVADRPIQMGDYVVLEPGNEGYVERIGWRSTRIRTLGNNTIVVPNSKLAQSTIKNYSFPSRETALAIDCSVAYGSDLGEVEKVTVDVAKQVLSETKGGMKDFEPFVRYSSFGESGINFSAILRVEEFADKSLVTHEFIKALHERYQKAGIGIPYPRRHVYLEDAGKTKKKAK